MKSLEKYINLIKMDDINIKRKNKASIITIICELIKVITVILLFNKLSTLTIKITLIYSIISIITAIYILHNDNYKKIYKYLILDFSAIIFFISNIIGGILIELIILPVDKKILSVEKEELKKEQNIKKLPIKSYHKNIVYIYLFISIIIGYQYLKINDYIFYLLVFISLIYFFKDDIVVCIKSLKKQYKIHLRYIFNNFFKIYLLNIISFTIISLIVGADSTNQTIINQESLIFNAIFSIIYAPIAEELLFRGCLRKIIKNDTLFILISGFTFGAWHVIGYDQSLIQYLYIIPYSLVGIGISYTYTKTNNIMTNIGIHALNNILATIGTII